MMTVIIALAVAFFALIIDILAVGVGLDIPGSTEAFAFSGLKCGALIGLVIDIIYLLFVKPKQDKTARDNETSIEYVKKVIETAYNADSINDYRIYLKQCGEYNSCTVEICYYESVDDFYLNVVVISYLKSIASGWEVNRTEHMVPKIENNPTCCYKGSWSSFAEEVFRRLKSSHPDWCIDTRITYSVYHPGKY